MRLKMTLCNTSADFQWLSGPAWTEYHDRVGAVDDKSAFAVALEMVNTFNKTVREGENVRRLLSAVLAGPTIGGEHEWRKDVGASVPGEYDKMVCRACGITGKRYGGHSTSPVHLDSKYANVIYTTCTPSPIRQQDQQQQEQSNMKQQPYELTEWYETAVHGVPVRTGPYETCANPAREDVPTMYRIWDNEKRCWSQAYRTLEHLSKVPRISAVGLPPLYWRGVTTAILPPLIVEPEKPKRVRKELIEDEVESPAQKALFEMLGSPSRTRHALADEKE